jgi:hypothetical protein
MHAETLRRLEILAAIGDQSHRLANLETQQITMLQRTGTRVFLGLTFVLTALPALAIPWLLPLALLSPFLAWVLHRSGFQLTREGFYQIGKPNQVTYWRDVRGYELGSTKGGDLITFYGAELNRMSSLPQQKETQIVLDWSKQYLHDVKTKLPDDPGLAQTRWPAA